MTESDQRRVIEEELYCTHCERPQLHAVVNLGGGSNLVRHRDELKPELVNWRTDNIKCSHCGAESTETWTV